MRFKQGREPVVEAEKEGSDRLSESTKVATAVQYRMDRQGQDRTDMSNLGSAGQKPNEEQSE